MVVGAHCFHRGLDLMETEEGVGAIVGVQKGVFGKGGGWR